MKIEILKSDNKCFRFTQFEIDFYPVKITTGLIFKTTKTYYPLDKCYVSAKKGNYLCAIYADVNNGEALDKDTCLKIHNLMDIDYKINKK